MKLLIKIMIILIVMLGMKENIIRTGGVLVALGMVATVVITIKKIGTGERIPQSWKGP